MAIQGYFFDAVQSGGVYDRLYTSEDFCNYLNLLVGNGVFPSPSTNLQVRAGSGMQVQVLAGSGWINGHKIVNTATMNLSVSAANATLNRIDRVVFYVDYTNRQMGISLKKGTAAGSPTAPSLQRNSSKYELSLATIQVNRQTTAITDSMITDTRSNNNVCGWVSALVDQLDSTTLFQQFTDAFNTWFADVQSQLRTAIRFKKSESTYVTQSAGEYVFSISSSLNFSYVYDILEIYINGLRLRPEEFSYNSNSVTISTPISEANTPVSIVVYQSVSQ